jgi:hypothetical protein
MASIDVASRKVLSFRLSNTLTAEGRSRADPLTTGAHCAA